MMSQRQAAFRADFRNRVSPWYSGLAHVVMIYAIGLAGIWYFVQQIGSPAWYEWLIVPAAFMIANTFEWWLHRYVMHRPIKGFMGIYKRHTLAHHQFFTETERPSIRRGISASPSSRPMRSSPSWRCRHCPPGS